MGVRERANALKGKSFLLAFLILLPILSWAMINVGGQVETRVYVDPQISTASPGETFTINIKIAKVKGLWDYEFRLKWEPALLNATSVTEGPLLSAYDHYKTFFVKKIWNEPDPMGVSGYIYVACTLMGETRTAAASGDGTLASVQFQVLNGGNCTLRLYETLLEDYDGRKMPHATEDGYFQYPPPTQIGVEPPSLIDPSLVPGNTFNINISITQAIEVYAWVLNMRWEPTILNVTKVKEGPFLNGEGTYNTTFNYQIQQEEGSLYANCSLLGELPEVSASGNGTLIVITFVVKAEGASVLRLYDTMLLDYEGAELLHVVKNGYFVNLLRDVAIVGVEVSPDKVKAGDSVTITVTAKNEGAIIESFDFTVYCDNRFLGTLGVSDLDPGAEKTLSFIWSTKNLVEGNYTIRVVASPVLWEIDVDDNTYVYEYVMVMPTEQSFPFMLIIAVVAIIVVAFASFMLLKRKR